MKKIILLIIMSLFFTSCKAGEDAVSNLSATGYLYAGHYIGTYSGDDSGTWDMTKIQRGKLQEVVYPIVRKLPQFLEV